MNNFRTEIKINSAEFNISHADNLMSIGSCFSENIGKKFSDFKFNININPFGQQYNPFSICNGINRLLEQRLYTKDELIFHDELFHSFDHHGSFSKATEKETLSTINEKYLEASEAIRKISILFLTPGTSHVFTLKENNKIVSNCHKLPSKDFNLRLMSANEIIALMQKTIQNLLAINPKLKIILTVSPVRYLAFGTNENSISKSHLFIAINELQKIFSQAFYFPSYEIMMDDLRDYRFYSADMIHPNQQAIEYIWRHLSETYFKKSTQQLFTEIENILNAINHKPRNPKSIAHQKFLKDYLEKIKRMANKNELNMNEEIERIKLQIEN